MPLVRGTPYTITEPARLAGELAATRRRGWAQTREEMTLGSCSMAVPVLGASGHPVAALGIAVTTIRATPARLVPALRSAADGVGARLPASADDRYPGLRHEAATHRLAAPGASA
ncbi:MAG TPA: IclR family transcriptional regulator C-terminal domain-containing protein [Micromonosporaceae bacterium]|nr:IclR family transcriptional regulator C-terminal domain-containing protein [Micromonosporaceae bacterium]